MGPSTAPTFHVNHGDRTWAVHPKRNEEAKKIDVNQDNHLDDAEIRDYLTVNGDLRDPSLAPEADNEKVLADYRAHLQGQLSPERFTYQTHEQIAQEMADLAEKFPNLATRVSLGKTHEGRDIWALKVTKDASSDDTRDRPAVVVTGAHHAREWATPLVPMNMAREALEAYDSDPSVKNRVDNGELWFIPVVNPDGYEFSRNENSFWRKNRRPITETPCGPVRGDVRGVDLNRNYYDGNPDNHWVWRPIGDDPCSYRDDGRATSDDPRKDTYRGPEGASEVEIQKLLELQLGRGNVKGILDYHSYGGMILYPWGHTRDKVDNVETYLEIGTKMNDALGGQKYRLMQSSSLYPTSGGSHDVHQMHDILSITMEIGDSFHPRESQLPDLVERNTKAGNVFIDEVLARA